MKKILLSLTAAITLASCATSTLELAGKSITLTELNNTELSVFNEDNPPTIMFDNNRVSATVGCNSIFAVYHTGKNGTISMSESGSTKMFCPEESREDEFIKAFNSIAGYSVAGDIISFRNKEGKIILKGRLR